MVFTGYRNRRAARLPAVGTIHRSVPATLTTSPNVGKAFTEVIVTPDTAAPTKADIDGDEPIEAIPEGGPRSAASARRFARVPSSTGRVRCERRRTCSPRARRCCRRCRPRWTDRPESTDGPLGRHITSVDRSVRSRWQQGCHVLLSRLGTDSVLSVPAHPRLDRRVRRVIGTAPSQRSVRSNR